MYNQRKRSSDLPPDTDNNETFTDTFRLDCALTKNTTLYEKARVLEALFGGDLGNRRGAAAGWAENILLKATKEIKQVTEDDGEALADVAVCLRDEELLRTL